MASGMAAQDSLAVQVSSTKRMLRLVGPPRDAILGTAHSVSEEKTPADALLPSTA